VTKLEVSAGPAQGPAATVIVRSDAVDWPVISGSGGREPGSHCHAVHYGRRWRAVPADPRVGTWPEDFTRVLRAIAADDPHGELFIGATAPAPGPFPSRTSRSRRATS